MLLALLVCKTKPQTRFVPCRKIEFPNLSMRSRTEHSEKRAKHGTKLGLKDEAEKEASSYPKSAE